MTSHIKVQFTIKDLERISGIKAHTIRIWEKRYHLLQPERISRNRRIYDKNSLKKLLNVKLLYDTNFKISDIAKMSSDQIDKKCMEIIESDLLLDHVYLDVLKNTTFTFDYQLFTTFYQQLKKTLTFEQIFLHVFAPYLNFIGSLWQTNTLKPAHEHFISNLILQKIHSQTDRLTIAPDSNKPTIILSLPQGEIHELSLLFLNYLFLKNKYPTIYLGTNISPQEQMSLLDLYPKAIFVTHQTMDIAEFDSLLEEWKHILSGSSSKVYMISPTDHPLQDQMKDQIILFNNFTNLLNIFNLTLVKFPI